MKPRPAELDEREDHELAEPAPVGAGVDHDQPGHAHGGR